MKSKTKWGALIAGIGSIAALVGHAISTGHPVPIMEIIAIVGGVITVWGARDAVAKIGTSR